MDLTPYVDNLRHELAVAAEAGGEDARALADRLTSPLESAIRLTLLNALSDATGEITLDLAPGSVDLRLRGLDPEFVVTPPFVLGPPEADEAPLPTAPAAPLAPPPGAADGEESGTARINFRLPAHLKSRIEETAAMEGLSVNAWLVRAAAAALEPAPRTTRAPAARRQNYTGWVR
ncbi:toxin-antitoxin system HicB family antitoxin [Kitasatospora sp. LaBMicrA B282]|uniref:toxin-antitoxin system HicB family antitoxin n=1 Tax=Kitasatospora sp. LaBMicrA B282 TaxID=3420949 RepID=UPI003D0D7DB1